MEECKGCSFRIECDKETKMSDKDKEKEFQALEKVFGQRERNSVKITDINMEEFSGDFDSIYEDEWFIVIDKQFVGETIGRELLDELDSELINDDKGEYDGDKIIAKIEDFVEIDDLVDKIKSFAIEYLNDNT